MTQCKAAFLSFAVLLLVSAGSLWADDAAPVATVQANPGAGAVAAANPDNPESPAATMKAAAALAEAGKTDEAVAAYEKMGVLKSKKKEGWRLNNEGRAYLIASTPAPEKAVPLLEKAVATDESNFVAWNNLGTAYEQTGQLAKAKDAYQKTIDQPKPGDSPSSKTEPNPQTTEPRLAQMYA